MAPNQTTSSGQLTLTARFDGRSDSYKLWRDQRLSLAALPPAPVITLPVSVFIKRKPLRSGASSRLPSENHAAISRSLARLCDQVRNHGFAVYQVVNAELTPQCDLTLEQSQIFAQALALGLGLDNSDEGVIRDAGQLSLLRDLSGTPRGRFIPYTSKAMNWHTDGYYNKIDSTLRSFTLHCVQAASAGGALTVMDPELLLIAMQQDNPDLVTELTHPEAMLLPANTDDQGHDRPDRTAAVFFCHADGELGLRFTNRTENIQWRTAATAAAAARATELIDAASQWQRQLRLQPGQGVITRNVLHCREAFSEQPDSPGRQMLRGRYMQAPDLQRSDQTLAAGGIEHAARQ